MLAHMAVKVHDDWFFITVGMAVMSITLLLGIQEAASIRLSGLDTFRTVFFYLPGPPQLHIT